VTYVLGRAEEPAVLAGLPLAGLDAPILLLAREPGELVEHSDGSSQLARDLRGVVGADPHSLVERSGVEAAPLVAGSGRVAVAARDLCIQAAGRGPELRREGLRSRPVEGHVLFDSVEICQDSHSLVFEACHPTSEFHR
jgi:hypothetical protein